MADFVYVTDNRANSSGNVVLVYDDTFEGLLTAVFESYSHIPAPLAIVEQQHQQLLGTRYERVETDDIKVERVIKGIRCKMGDDEYERIWQGFLSGSLDKGTVIYRYLRLGMRLGAAIRIHLTDERVMAMDKLVSLVGRESGLLTEFVRFSKMEGGVYYAKITPENNVLPFMMPFFADRFNVQPFLIHDTNRRIAGLYDTRNWTIASAEDLQIPEYAEDEKQYRQLWKRFYDTIAIKERINPQLRRQHMPRHFWRNITEMTMTDDAPPTLLPSDISRAKAQLTIGNKTGSPSFAQGLPDIRSGSHGTE